MAQPKPHEMARIDHQPPQTGWMDTPVTIKDGMYCHPAKLTSIQGVGMPNPHEWHPNQPDWHLPADWRTTVKEGIRERLERFRSFKLFMDICVRCGACADKCHFFIGTGDPKNMPVLRAELLRSVYRGEFKTAGKLLGKLAGGSKLTEEVIRSGGTTSTVPPSAPCSDVCPYGIVHRRETFMAR